MAKKKYTPQQYAQVGMICVILVIFGVLMPYYHVTDGHNSKKWNGLDEPFLGLWVLILSGVAAACAGAYGISLVGSALAKPLLALGGACYFVAWVLCMVDSFRDVQEFFVRDVYGRNWGGFRLFGVYTATAGALAGAIFTFAPLAALAKKEEVSSEGGSPEEAE